MWVMASLSHVRFGRRHVAQACANHGTPSFCSWGWVCRWTNDTDQSNHHSFESLCWRISGQGMLFLLELRRGQDESQELLEATLPPLIESPSMELRVRSSTTRWGSMTAAQWPLDTAMSETGTPVNLCQLHDMHYIKYAFGFFFSSMFSVDFASIAANESCILTDKVPSLKFHRDMVIGQC